MSFASTENKGFTMTFANGYTISCQFGAGNYCDHYARKFASDYKFMEETHKSIHSCGNCEVAIFKNGVKGSVATEIVKQIGMDADECGCMYCVTTDDVAKIIAHLVTL